MQLTPRVKGWIAGLAVFGATLAVYAPAVRNDFVLYDDPKYVTGNSHVRAGLSLDGVRWALATGHASNWHPTTWLSHMLDASIFGPSPAGHHFTSVLLHALNALLLFVLLEIATGSTGRSALVAALFGLHPLHVESVAWVAERKDVLSTLFWFLTTIAYVRWTRLQSPGRYLLVVAGMAVGLTAKPMLVTLPFTLLLLDVWPLNRAREGALSLVREKLPLFALSLASCVVTLLVQRAGGAISNLETYPSATRIANALVSVAVYLRKTIWPSDLAVYYPYPKELPPASSIAASALVVGLVCALVVRERRRKPFLAVGWLWFLGTLVPVLGFVQVGLQSMADRYTYIPLVGIFIMVAWSLPSPASVRVAVPACAVLAGLAACTIAQIHTWKDSKSLFAHALDVTIDNAVAHADLGDALMGEGRLDDAAQQFRLSLAIRPGHPRTLFWLGSVLERSGHTDEAIDAYDHALRIDPELAGAHTGLGRLLAAQGKTDDAIEHFQAAVRIDPSDTTARADLERTLEKKSGGAVAAAGAGGADELEQAGVELAGRGKIDEAIERFREAIERKPTARTLVNLGLALDANGRHDEAIASFRRALSLDPANAEAHVSLGAALAAVRRYDDAMAQYDDGLRLRPNYPEALNNYGSALIAVGRAQDACARLRGAIALRPDYAKAHYNLAVALCMKGDYAESWSEVRACRGLGFAPPPAFLTMLSGHMGEPK